MVELRFQASNLVVDGRTSLSGVEPRCRWTNFDLRRRTSLPMVELRFPASKLDVDRRFPASNFVVDGRNLIIGVELRCRSQLTHFAVQLMYFHYANDAFRYAIDAFSLRK